MSKSGEVLHPAPPSGDGKRGVLGLLKRAGHSRREPLYDDALHPVCDMRHNRDENCSLPGGPRQPPHAAFLFAALDSSRWLGVGRAFPLGLCLSIAEPGFASTFA